MKATIELCINETGATVEEISDYYKKPVLEKNPNKEILCFLKCTFEKMGYLKEDGTVCVETLKKEDFLDGTEEIKAKKYDCVKNLNKITSCEDMEALQNCLELKE